jgi:hypothetical protein
MNLLRLVLFIALIAAPVVQAQTGASSPSPAASTSTATSVTVWVNTATGVYHYQGTRWYGNTKHGKYMSEADAIKEGDRPAMNGQ